MLANRDYLDQYRFWFSKLIEVLQLSSINLIYSDDWVISILLVINWYSFKKGVKKLQVEMILLPREGPAFLLQYNCLINCVKKHLKSKAVQPKKSQPNVKSSAGNLATNRKRNKLEQTDFVSCRSVHQSGHRRQIQVWNNRLFVTIH